MGSFFRRWERGDLLFLALTFILLVVGLGFLYSATSVFGADQHGDTFYFLKRQAVFGVIGLLIVALLQGLSLEGIVKSGGIVLVVSIAFLALLFVPSLGVGVKGASRWLNLGPFRFQPSELAKVACIIYMSWALSKKGDKVKSFTYGILPMAIVGGVLLGMILSQPDFGNAVIIAALTFLMLFLAGARVSYLLLGLMVLVPVAYQVLLSEGYRRRRLLSFLNPWNDPQNTSYQIVQSYSAFYKGGLFGQGMGNSQEKLYFLPEVHTDFVGAVIVEEIGFIGFVLFLGLFAFLVFRGFYIASRSTTRSGYLLAAGASSLLGLQGILNLCVIMGLVPTKGLPLPFVSHGGSSLIASLVLCGLILSVSSNSVEPSKR